MWLVLLKTLKKVMHENVVSRHGEEGEAARWFQKFKHLQILQNRVFFHVTFLFYFSSTIHFVYYLTKRSIFGFFWKNLMANCEALMSQKKMNSSIFFFLKSVVLKE